MSYHHNKDSYMPYDKKVDYSRNSRSAYGRGQDSRGGPRHYQPSGGSSGQFQHKPKIGLDYRNTNIHKYKRTQGSNVMSPRTERMLAQQFKTGKPMPGFDVAPPEQRYPNDGPGYYEERDRDRSMSAESYDRHKRYNNQNRTRSPRRHDSRRDRSSSQNSGYDPHRKYGKRKSSQNLGGKYAAGSRFGGFKDSRPEDSRQRRSPDRPDDDYYQSKYQKGQDGHRVNRHSPSPERGYKPRLLEDPMAQHQQPPTYVKQESGIQDHLVKNEYYYGGAAPIKQEQDSSILGYLAFGDAKDGGRKLMESQKQFAGDSGLGAAQISQKCNEKLSQLIKSDVESMEAQLKSQIEGIPKEFSSDNEFLENLIKQLEQSQQTEATANTSNGRFADIQKKLEGAFDSVSNDDVFQTTSHTPDQISELLYRQLMEEPQLQPEPIPESIEQSSELLASIKANQKQLEELKEKSSWMAPRLCQEQVRSHQEFDSAMHAEAAKLESLIMQEQYLGLYRLNQQHTQLAQDLGVRFG